MIIAVEGIDGAGKNTLVTAVASRFGAETLGFPRYAESMHAQLAADALHGRMGDLTDSAHAMATLFALDRYGVAEQLQPYKAAQHRHIILDRFVASNAAYSWARTGDPDMPDWIYHLEFERLGIPAPDMQILLSTDPNEAQRRAQQRSAENAHRPRDRYERDSDLQQRTFEAYGDLARAGWGSPWLITADPNEAIATIESLIQATKNLER